MARYKYSGRDRRGKKSGAITAPSKREAVLKLKEQGIRTLEITEVPETILNVDITIGNPVKLQDFVVYLRQFSTLIKAGVSAVDSTRILANQTESKALRKALLDIEQSLREGKPLSEAATKHSKIFSFMFINMVKAGEAGGNLDESLELLADHFEKQNNVRSKIISALAYPVVVLIIAVAVVIFMLVSIVPTFVSMFDDFGGELPWITQIVLGASDFMQVYWWAFLLFFLLIVVGIVLIRRNKDTKYYLDYFLLKLPVFGKMIQKAALSRMTRTLSSLVANAVPILEAVRLVEDVVENEVIARVLRQCHDSLERGRSMTEPMKDHWAFPPLITQMISIGEQTGSLDAMLGKVADFYEVEVENSTERVKSMLEPIMIVILAGLVGTIVLAIVVPMFEMFNNVG